MIPGIAPTGLDTVRAGLAQIARIADPERMQQLDLYERLYKGLAYEGRPSFWDTTVPLHERAPCVTSGLPEAAGRRLCALVFGARQFPRFTAGTPAANAVVADVVRLAMLPLRMRAALEQGLMLGTWCLILGVREGLPVVQIQSAKLCTPDLDAAGRVRSLDVRYRYQGKLDGRQCTLWFRRVIDATRDVQFLPVAAREDGYEPEWIEDAERTIEHGLGFCPVVWHRHNADPSDTDALDGTPLFAGLEGELEALDFALSQRHRNGRYNGEPQIVVTGSDPEGMDAPAGRTARPGGAGLPSDRGGDSAKFSWFNSLFGRGRTESASQKAPNKVWFIETPGASATLLESSGAGARVLSEDAADLRRLLLEARQIVIASPEQVSANASAALMEALHAPMIDHADVLRLEYGPAVVEVVSMLLRILASYEARASGSVRVEGFGPIAQSLASAKLTLTWGRYYEPTLADITQAVTAASVATGSMPVLSHPSAVRFVARLVGIDDVDAEVSKITGAAERDQAALAALPTETAPAASGAPVEAVADTALNGAQVTSLVEILAAVSEGRLPVESARPLILAAFPSFDDARVESMLSPLRRRDPGAP